MNSAATYYLVVDLEATCDDRNTIPRDESEIIEIGGVLVDGATFRAVGEFQTFVRPIVHPKLTPFCTELTTITQADVDAAPTFPAAAARLAAFGKDTVFCSWGNYDRNQLTADAQRHGVPMPLPGEHINLQNKLAKLVGRLGNREALSRFGMTATGTYHRGIDDARNIARLLPFALGRAPIPTEVTA